MACKCRFSCKYTILPFSILILSLSQLYFQYSSFMTKRNQNLEEQDKRHQLYTLNFIFGKRYEFNLGEIDNYFNDNALMKIPQLKDLVEKGFNKWNEKREKKLDLKLYEIFYLIIYDLIFIIFLYLFIFKSFKAGIIKIIIQLLKFVFTMINFKKKYGNICLCKIIYNHCDMTHLRGSEFFDAEGCEISEFLCNLVIVLDIIWLIIIKRDARKNDNNLPETEFIIKKQILTDENRVDYNEEGQGTIKLTEEKIYSNENNQESDEDKDKDKDENDNINNNDDENDNQNENEKDDEEINNNKYDEDNENINNIKDEDDDQENNCESNENNYNNYQNPEVNNSLNDNKEKEEEENNEEEEGIDENIETK